MGAVLLEDKRHVADGRIRETRPQLLMDVDMFFHRRGSDALKVFTASAAY
jgi:hypothetical protein